MANNAAQDEKSIFLAAVDIKTDADRAKYLHEACGGDSDLLAKVQALLRAYYQPCEVLASPEVLTPTAAVPPAEKPGTVIGPYKLLQVIGEGGMGVVYMAEQSEPVRRRVAFKLIKPGMDSRQVLARFEAERQALAMMDHPNIARVLDAGVTESGRPYFVMDLVKGVPIDQYCDEHNLSTRERLDLFIHVCHALQHAHHKGVVHRDVKPSNVLVAEFDNQVVPKIIDFGVAKAIDQQLTEKTMFTQFGQIIGTPEYMSPEQAKLNQLDVDTRSDIYSLGVLLYELLTGSTPFDRQRLRSVAFDELLRIIREEEPPRPSVRLSTVNELAKVATNRNSEPGKLSGLLRGELDWLVMKAMDKQRSRRYDTASALADDVQRYLDGDPIVACPPSRSYLLRKTVSRHKVAMGATAAVIVALLLGVIGTAWMAWRAGEQRRAALQAQRDAEQAKITADQQRQLAEDFSSRLRDQVIEKAFITIMSGDLQNIDQAIESAVLVGAEPSKIETLRGLAAMYEGEVEKSLAHLRQAIEHNPKDLAAWLSLRVANWLTGQYYMRSYTASQIQQNGLDQFSGCSDDIQKLISLQINQWPDKLQELNDLIARHPSWALARAARASVLANRYQLRNDLEQAEQDVMVIREILPNSPLMTEVELAVYVAMLETCDKFGWDQDYVRRCADEAATKLARFPRFLYGRHRLRFYFWAIGEPELADRELQAIRQSEWGGRWARAMDCYRDNELSKAERLLAEEPHVQSDILMGFVLAERDRSEALKAFANVLNRPDARFFHKVKAVDILMLVGEDITTIQNALRKMKSTQLTDDKPLTMDRLAFLLDEIDESEYLERAGRFGNAKLHYGYYTIGMRHLATGNREKAKEWLAKVCEGFRPGQATYHNAEAFLKRLEEDPDWPARIQRTESPSP